MSVTKARIMLVDDHPIVREGYRRLIERHHGYHVVAEADDAASAYRLYRQHEPDITVVDLTLPGPGGLEAIRHIRQWDRAAKLLVFTMHQTATLALKAFEAGARGFVTKSSEPVELVNAIETVLSGGRALSPDIARQIADGEVARRSHGEGDEVAAAISDLSTRETEILRMLTSGMATEDIAKGLSLSLKTIQNNHYQIKAKLGARTDAHLVWIALEAGLVDRPEG